ncbi:hypothetical protein C8F01DRAFT_1281481 [Mycena amicta]|nr:hypothetical protein C8F01DRAFT_1281481 [Mycena amicta]
MPRCTVYGDPEAYKWNRGTEYAINKIKESSAASEREPPHAISGFPRTCGVQRPWPGDFDAWMSEMRVKPATRRKEAVSRARHAAHGVQRPWPGDLILKNSASENLRKMARVVYQRFHRRRVRVMARRFDFEDSAPSCGVVAGGVGRDSGSGGAGAGCPRVRGASRHDEHENEIVDPMGAQRFGMRVARLVERHRHRRASDLILAKMCFFKVLSARRILIDVQARTRMPVVRAEDKGLSGILSEPPRALNWTMMMGKDKRHQLCMGPANELSNGRAVGMTVIRPVHSAAVGEPSSPRMPSDSVEAAVPVHVDHRDASLSPLAARSHSGGLFPSPKSPSRGPYPFVASGVDFAFSSHFSPVLPGHEYLLVPTFSIKFRFAELPSRVPVAHALRLHQQLNEGHSREYSTFQTVISLLPAPATCNVEQLHLGCQGSYRHSACVRMTVALAVGMARVKFLFVSSQDRRQHMFGSSAACRGPVESPPLQTSSGLPAEQVGSQIFFNWDFPRVPTPEHSPSWPGPVKSRFGQPNVIPPWVLTIALIMKQLAV